MPWRRTPSIVSVRVLGPDNRGKGTAFAAGLEWAIEQGVGVVNLSLSSRSDAMFGVFHELADQAYFANVLLVCAANNVAGPVVSVALRVGRLGRRPRRPDPAVWFYNPAPPVEFGAYGRRRRRRLAGRRRGWSRPGNCSPRRTWPAMPRGSGRRHPEASPFEVKAILAATADAATEPDDGPPGALTAPRPQGSETPRRLAGGASSMAKDVRRSYWV